MPQTQPVTLNLVDFCLPFIPWVVVLVVVWFLVVRITRRQSQQIAQAVEQRRAIQDKLDRIIVLLEERSRL